MKVMAMRYAIRPLMIAVVSLVLSACGSSGSSVMDLSPTTSVGASSGYIIGPGDMLNIYVWRNEDLTVTVPVRPDGRISTPLVEDMQAVGKTPTQLARDIELVLEEFIRTPQVNVIVESFVGTFNEQIRVVGQASAPQALSFREGMTLLDVMIEVGGLTEYASGNRARVVRGPAGQHVEIRVRLNDLLNRGDISQNIAMRPGDILIIPGSFF